MLTSDGDQDPSSFKKLLWGVIVAIVCVGLLMAGGGGSGALKPLQTISLVAAFPFMFVMFAICVAFKKALDKNESARIDKQRYEDATKALKEEEESKASEVIQAPEQPQPTGASA